MKRTAEVNATTPRVVVVSSGVHYNAQVPELMEILSAPRLLDKLSEESSFPVSSGIPGEERYKQCKREVHPPYPDDRH